MCTNVWEYIHVGECISTFVSVYLCICVNACACLSTCDCVYVWLCVRICERVLGCLCVWVCECEFVTVWAWECARQSPTHEPSDFKLSKTRMCVWFQQGARTRAVGIRREWLQLALRLLLLTTLQLCHLPPPLPPPSGALLACSRHASPCELAVVLTCVLL